MSTPIQILSIARISAGVAAFIAPAFLTNKVCKCKRSDFEAARPRRRIASSNLPSRRLITPLFNIFVISLSRHAFLSIWLSFCRTVLARILASLECLLTFQQTDSPPVRPTEPAPPPTALSPSQAHPKRLSKPHDWSLPGISSSVLPSGILLGEFVHRGGAKETLDVTFASIVPILFATDRILIVD